MKKLLAALALLLLPALAAAQAPTVTLVQTGPSIRELRAQWSPISYGVPMLYAVAWTHNSQPASAATHRLTRDSAFIQRAGPGIPDTITVCVAALYPDPVTSAPTQYGRTCGTSIYPGLPLPPPPPPPVPPPAPPPGPPPPAPPPPAPVPPPAPPGPPGALHPNEPAGLTKLSERGFSAKVEDGWRDRGDANFSIVSDPTAPYSAAQVGQALFQPRMSCGVGPINTWKILSPRVRTLYVSFWLKLDPVWVGNKANINKVLFLWIAEGARVIAMAYGHDANGLQAVIGFQGMGTHDATSGGSKTGISWNGYPNQNTGVATIPRGQWVRWEILLHANTPGKYDGQAHWWLNGTKIGQYTAIGYSSPTETGAKNAFQQVSWNPTYGGGCNGAYTVDPVTHVGHPTVDQFPVPQWMRIDHMYVSGKP